MSEVQPIPEGCEGVIPHLVVDNCDKALAFYREAFGAEEVCRMPTPDGRKIMHAEIRIGAALLYLCDDFPEFCGGTSRHPKALGHSPVSIHQYVLDADAAIERARQAGAEVAMPAQDMFWGDRYGTVKDPFGHHWSFATHLKDLSPEEMAQACQAAFRNEATAPS